MANVLLGVTGCIAAYKAAELVRLFRVRGWRVKVVMTAHATEFITPLTLETLSGEPVATDLFEGRREGPLPHLSLADEANCIVIAPATANVLGKLAGGVADDLLTTTVLASTAPLVIAPAMNTKMWTAESSRKAVGVLQERGAVVVDPASGLLACGQEGEGRLAALESIVDAVKFELDRSVALTRRRVVVTAGGTQEPLDPVRFLGNRSSGRMGFALADEACRMGADVVLITAPSALPRPYGVCVVEVRTAREMRDAVLAEVGPEAPAHTDVLIMAAAVADYRPEESAPGKMKKQDSALEVRLVPNPDILEEVGRRRRDDLGGWPAVLVGFAAETAAGAELVKAAEGKLESKGADLMVANNVLEPDQGFGSLTNHVVVVDRFGSVDWVGPALKRDVAREVLTHVCRALEGGPGPGAGPRPEARARGRRSRR